MSAHGGPGPAPGAANLEFEPGLAGGDLRRGLSAHGFMPTPRALFSDDEGKQRRRPDPACHADSSLSRSVREAAARGDFLAVERLAIKLLSLARQEDARGIQELAGDALATREVPGRSRPSGGGVHFSPCITAVAVDPQGCLHAEYLPSGVKGADTVRLHGIADARTDAQHLLGLLEPFMAAAGMHANTHSPQASPIMRPSAPGHSLAALRDSIMKVAHHARCLTSQDPRLLALESPCHVLGDLHGNLVDLQFFRNCLWPAGPAAAAGSFVFLGDFVDRGPDSVAVAAYVMAMKVCVTCVCVCVCVRERERERVSE